MLSLPFAFFAYFAVNNVQEPASDFLTSAATVKTNVNSYILTDKL